MAILKLVFPTEDSPSFKRIFTDRFKQYEAWLAVNAIFLLDQTFIYQRCDSI
jgi:hypothetical protein